MKKALIIGGIILAGIAVYYTGIYTYFITTKVQEALPTPAAQQDQHPKTVVEGSFGEIDVIHKGFGTAKIIEVNGKRILRFENFEVTNGPDLYVYLSESTAPTNDIKSLDKYISLGRLKGNIGDQNYEIPEPFRGYNTAIIWCQKFGVLFSYAIMK